MKRGLISVATGEYNRFIPKLIETSQFFFENHFYIFTDQPNRYKQENVTVIEIEHLGWPKMPLLRFEMLHKFHSIFKEDHLFLIDSEAEFKMSINKIFNNPKCPVDSSLVATMHRNITRKRKEFNYETRPESSAFISEDEGEKYFACGLVGGSNEEFKKLCKTLTESIRKDIKKGIRAIWGDESHLNRYFIDNEPTLILPPNFMCPQFNSYFIQYITHRDKKFKKIWNDDAKKYLTIEPDEYRFDWQPWIYRFKASQEN